MAVSPTVITTIGQPWLLLIVLPVKTNTLYSLLVVTCSGIFSDTFRLTAFALFDLLVALTPAALLMPTPPAHPTPAPAPAPADPIIAPRRITPFTEAAKPASQSNHPAGSSAKSGDSGKGSSTPSPDPASMPDDSAVSPKIKGDSPSDRSADLPSDPP